EHPRPIGPFPLRLSRGFTHLSRRDMARALLSGHRMIRETFVHIAGVGYRIVERIWRSGIRTWDDFSAAPRPPRIGQRLALRIEDEVERSAEALRSGRHRYFAPSCLRGNNGARSMRFVGTSCTSTSRRQDFRSAD